MPDLTACTVAISKTLTDVLRAIDGGHAKIAIVTDEEGRLVGTMTDGDVRRALLDGATMGSLLEPHVQRRFTSVPPTAGRAEVLDLMRARDIEVIPIVAGDGRVVGLHTLREIVGAVERPNWAVVMAGGRGVRLRPLTEVVPKPMVPVAGRPVLERIVLHLVGFGIRRIFLAIHYLGHTIEQHFGDGSGFGCRIEYVREPTPRGSGGALALLGGQPVDPVIVMNGDLVTQVNIGAMLESHLAGGCRATVGLKEYRHQIPFGCVDVEGGRIVRLEEKPLVSELVNAGIYVLSPELLPRVPPDSEFAMTSLIEGCLQRGEPVGAFLVEDEWIDIGHTEQLRIAREGPA